MTPSLPFTICIIDDDKIYKFIIKKTLEIKKLASKVLVFSDGEEALIYIFANIKNTHKLPDIIFLDINMPIMDGFQFMDEYVKIKPRLDKKIIIYMVTSSVDPADLKRAKEYNEIFDYIIKPIQPDEFTKIINAIKS
jgi:CheY-like chemotaxis protein